jgi:hypothetical protein
MRQSKPLRSIEEADAREVLVIPAVRRRRRQTDALPPPAAVST